ncbi:hypothetical protein FQN60_000154 [Etheostoma spectabile]|uniref:Uncharacterized protein n=1 Tax=Etheostoma spectabile TaxID=54343 RepID=A0A5J5CUZ9_9PERO|nr:hypothetical protein FQN60_000154 [Etheostoma spectabile]
MRSIVHFRTNGPKNLPLWREPVLRCVYFAMTKLHRWCKLASSNFACRPGKVTMIPLALLDL